MYQLLKEQLNEHYSQLNRGSNDSPATLRALEIREKIYRKMDELFPESPFFFEMGLRDRFS